MLTLQGYIQFFQTEAQKKGRGLATLKSIKGVLMVFVRFLTRRKIVDIREVKKTDISAYEAYIARHKRKDGTPSSTDWKYRHLCTLMRWFNFLADKEYILINPAVNVQPPKPPKVLPRNVLTEDEARRLVEAAKPRTLEGIRDRALLEVLYGSALRCAEARNLKLADVDMESCWLYVTGKGSKDRVVPMTKAARRCLKHYLGKTRPVYVKNTGSEILFLSKAGTPLKGNAVAKVLRTLSLKAGIAKKVTPHTLRHSCATHLMARGAGVRYVQDFLGHTDIETTQVYTHVMPMELKKVYEKTHPRCIRYGI